MKDKELDFYKSLRSRMMDWLESRAGRNHKWADYLMLAPDLFHVLCKLSVDKDVPAQEKVKLVGAIAYFISPIDLIPEAIVGPVGYVDDIALAAYVLNSVINNTDPEVVRKHWAGEDDVLEVVQKILKVADKMVGGVLWKKIKRMFK